MVVRECGAVIESWILMIEQCSHCVFLPRPRPRPPDSHSLVFRREMEQPRQRRLTKEERESMEKVLENNRDIHGNLRRGAKTIVAKMFDVHPATVGRLWARARTSNVEPRYKGNSGRPIVHNRQDFLKIVTSLEPNKRQTCEQIAAQAGTSDSTAHRIMTKEGMKKVSSCLSTPFHWCLVTAGVGAAPRVIDTEASVNVIDISDGDDSSQITSFETIDDGVVLEIFSSEGIDMEWLSVPGYQPIYRKSFRTLRDGERLNDEVINTHLELVTRATNGKAHAYSTYFITKLLVYKKKNPTDPDGREVPTGYFYESVQLDSERVAGECKRVPKVTSLSTSILTEGSLFSA
jgi:hypothetical protein